MELSREKLSKFDLETELERELLEGENQEQLFEFLQTFSEILIVDRFIRECPSYPGSTEEIMRDEMVSAIGATLAIEGTTLRPEEIKESFEKADLQRRLQRKEQEAQNSRNVYKYIINVPDKEVGGSVYSQDHIKQIHRYFTENIAYPGNVPGQYRDATAYFGYPRRVSLCDRRAEIAAIMENFIDWLNKTSTGPLSGNPIVKAIMAHYYLAEIHPFGDGNGRTARALEALVLYKNKINTYCFWSLANFWSTHRDQYLVHLDSIHATCSPWDFLIWGTKGYLQEIKRVKDLVLKKVKQLMLQDYIQWLWRTQKYRKPKPAKRMNRRILGVLTLLIHVGETPFDKFLSSPELQTLYADRTTSTRHRDFEKMKNLALIRFSSKDKIRYVGPNYELLERLQYEV